VSGPVAPTQDWLVRNGAILAGLAIGTVAKYGLTLTGAASSAGAASSPTSVMVPAGVGELDAVTMQPGTADADTARAGTSLKHAHRAPTRQRPREDQIELLRRLDVPDTPTT